MKREIDPVELEVAGKVGGLAITFVVIALLAGGLLAWLDWPKTSAGWAEAGTKGDFWGGHFGPPLALAGAALFFLAIFLQLKQLFMQREELKLQREELAATREEMKEARGVYEAQREMMERQALAAEQSVILHHACQLMTIHIDAARYHKEALGTEIFGGPALPINTNGIQEQLRTLATSTALTNQQKQSIQALLYPDNKPDA